MDQNSSNNREIELIPLDNKVNKCYPNILNMNNKSAYFSDTSILPRIQKYLEGRIDMHYVDINIMADDLQKLYPKDYAKRKRNAFRAMVKKAYGALMKAYGNSTYESSSEELSGESYTDETFANNSLNNQLVEMYGRNLHPPTKPIQDNELIDISSDDSADEAPPKKSNGAAVSASTSNSNSRLNSVPILESILTRDPAMSVISLSASPEKTKKRKLENINATPLNMTKKKRTIQPVDLQDSKVSFKDIGGLDKVLENICQLLVHIKHPEVYRQIGISPPRGFLLHGPPGCGKTLLANCIAGELEVPLLKVAAPELVAGVSGESEERIRELFERATVAAPCILFIDEIDAITPNRQFAQKDMERRIVAQLLTCMDDLSKSENGDQVLVIGATNRPDALDPALRRAGRFDREVSLGIPDTSARLNILKVLTAKLRLEDEFDYNTLAKYTPGYVGADLMSLTREAAMVAVNRVFNEIKEKNKLAKAIARQEFEQKQAKKAEKIDKPAETVTSSKILEPEIIVDTETTDGGDADIDVDAKPETQVEDDGEDAAVVVIDVDSKKSAEVTDVKNAVVPSTSAKANVDKPTMELTSLEELIFWLHNDAPLSQEQLTVLFITGEDFAKALKFVQPSAKREGFATVPDVTWDDVGSLSDIREELQLSILAPVRHAEQFQALGISSPTGVLLCGPPGCGKTLLAKAIANEAGINFISVKGPELLNMYVGESERAVRLCFERARNSAPCVIFFDELDALCPKRSDSREGGSTMRLVNQMLTEMDGVQSRTGVYLLAASNRPDIIDPAVLRPGRLDKILYVGLPTPQDRVDILRTITKNGTKPLLAPDVDLEIIGNSSECEGYTGADLAALVREAGVHALREVIVLGDLNKPIVVTTDNFKHAVEKIRPSVSEKDKQHYAKLKKIYSAKQADVEEMEYS